MTAKPFALLMLVAVCPPLGCKLRPRPGGETAAPSAEGDKAVPRYDLAKITVARSKRVGARLGLEVVGDTRDGDEQGYHEQFVPLGEEGGVYVYVTLWDFSRGRKGETIAHRVRALQALSVYTSEPKHFEPTRILEQLLAGASLDTITVADLKRAIARANLKLDFCDDEESTYAYQQKHDDSYDTSFWIKDAEDHDLYLKLMTYRKAVKHPTFRGTQVITDADRVLMVFSADERRWPARDFVKALLDDRAGAPASR